MRVWRLGAEPPRSEGKGRGSGCGRSLRGPRPMRRPGWALWAGPPGPRPMGARGRGLEGAWRVRAGSGRAQQGEVEMCRCSGYLMAGG